MRNLMRTIIMCAIGLMPVAAAAANQPLLVQATPPAAVSAENAKILVIGAGIVMGAAAGSLLTARGATLIGAIAGGLIGAWWYGEHSDIAGLEPRKK